MHHRVLRATVAAFLALLLTTLPAPTLPAPPQDAGAGQGPGLISSSLPLPVTTGAALAEEISGEIAMHHLREITQHHRIQGSPMMREAARYVLGRLQEYGLGDAAMESYLSDGRKTYQTWLSPVGWTVEEAELWMIAPVRRRVARFSEIAMSLVTVSASADEQGMLVDAGTGIEPSFYDSVDVSGRIVLASGYGGDVHRMAVLGHGALGVVCWSDDPDHPDKVRYTGMWPKAGERDRVRWGFNVSYREGQQLKRMLAAGEPVRLHAIVKNGSLQDGSLDVVTATIRGARFPDQEILLMAHLDHPRPSANDNASGSSTLLEIARALRRLIDEDRIPRPERSIRFLWVPEMFGTAAWLDAHADVGGRTAFALNLDMVGTPGSVSVMQIVQAPGSSSSILDGVAAEAARWVSGLGLREPRGVSGPLNYRVVPYSGGSDHYMVMDGAVGVPAVMFNTWPDPWYHSSEDTPDKIDPTTLKRAGVMAAASALTLADLGPAGADLLLADQVATGLVRLSRDQRMAVAHLETLDPGMDDVTVALVVQDAESILEAQLDGEMRTLASILRLSRGVRDSSTAASLQSSVTRARAQLEAHGALVRDRVMEVELPRIAGPRDMLPLPRLLPIAPLPARDEAASLIYERTTRGPINDDWLLAHLPAGRSAYYLQGPGRTIWADADRRYELVNFVNGSRSVLEIRNALMGTYGAVPIEPILTYLRDLEATGLLRRLNGPR